MTGTECAVDERGEGEAAIRENVGMNHAMVAVLRHISEHFTSPGVHRLDVPFAVPGLTFDGEVAPALRRLTTADPPYVEGVSVAEMDYPVVVTGLTERGWEAAEAAGDARDAGPGGIASTPLPTAVASSGRTFQVALSFAGEQRGYVQRVASALAALSIHYFYDEEQKIPLWGKNQVEELQRIYKDDAYAVVMFISSDYARKSWPIHERRSALSRAVRERREYVLPLRFDDTPLPGFDPDVSYLKAEDFSPEDLAAAIAQKLVTLGGSIPAAPGPLIGSARAATGRSTGEMTVSVIDESGQPVAGAQVLAAAPNGTYVSAIADNRGAATLRLPARRLVTIYVAHSAAAPALVRDHDPVGDLDVTLPRPAGVGSVIFEAGTGHIPGLTGRLNPIRDSAGGTERYYLYADNISIDDLSDQPSPFAPGQPLALEDALGGRVIATVVEVIGRSSLILFRR